MPVGYKNLPEPVQKVPPQHQHSPRRPESTETEMQAYRKKTAQQAHQTMTS